MKAFDEAQLEAAIIELLAQQGFPHTPAHQLNRTTDEVLIAADWREYLQQKYAAQGITAGEAEQALRVLSAPPAEDLYASNRDIHYLITAGFTLRRENPALPDLHIWPVDFAPVLGQQDDHGGHNLFRLVSQLTVQGRDRKRIPDAVLYINGLPLVVFEFKSSKRESVTLQDAFKQLTVRYTRDIPQLMKYNALCVISDGANTRMGSVFAQYDFFYAWKRVAADRARNQIHLPDGQSRDVNDINTVSSISELHTLLQGAFAPRRLLDIIQNFIYFPDSSHTDIKVLCRYPQYYATRLLLENIRAHQKPAGDGKGGTYFGTTGCGKSYTMLFLSRLLMRSVAFASPTLVLITDRTDLDEQLAKQFCNAKRYIGDQLVESVQSRADLRAKLKGRQRGGVLLTTIHKFTEDTELLTERSNVVCISDEAHRSQINLEQKITLDHDQGIVKKSYGFAKYLHDSLPNATYVGFTGTPVDATLDVFGEIVDAYTMTESVADNITVPVVYEGRAAKVVLDNNKLRDIEDYYQACAELGASDEQIEQSKRASANMNAILGDPDRLQAVAEDFVQHYETRVAEGSSVKGKAMFVCSSRDNAWLLYQKLVALRPAWQVAQVGDEQNTLTEEQRKKILPLPRINMVMTRSKDDDKTLYALLGSKEDRERLAAEFKQPQSNFRIAIVVDMWLTGFDVPFLDTMYLDKPLQTHNLIQTISRVNRTFAGKPKGLVVDYIGIKNALNLAMKQYASTEQQQVEDIQHSVVIVRDLLDVLGNMLYGFDSSGYFSGEPVAQLHCLNMAGEFVQKAEKLEKRFMAAVKRLRAAYDICSGSEALTEQQRDWVHFYFALRTIVFKLTRGDAPDVSQMNARVRAMVAEALDSSGVEEIIAIGRGSGEIDLFSDDYLAKLDKIKLPNTKIKLLQQLLARAIDDFKKINQVKGVEFSARMQQLVERYNNRSGDETQLVANVTNDFYDSIIDGYFAAIEAVRTELASGNELGLALEEKAFYDILLSLAVKYDFDYPEDRLRELAKAIKVIVDDQTQYIDWYNRVDIKARLKADLIMKLAEFGYPPVANDDAYKEVLQQAENFKKHQL